MASQQAECVRRAERALMYVKGRSFLRVEDCGGCPGRFSALEDRRNDKKCRPMPMVQTAEGAGHAIRSASHHHLAIIATCFTPTNT